MGPGLCGGWFTGRRGPDKLWSLLGGEVEQPLAQQIIVLFQVLYQVGLLLHHLLQIGALSVTNKRQIGLKNILNRHIRQLLILLPGLHSSVKQSCFDGGCFRDCGKQKLHSKVWFDWIKKHFNNVFHIKFQFSLWNICIFNMTENWNNAVLQRTKKRVTSAAFFTTCRRN